MMTGIIHFHNFLLCVIIAIGFSVGIVIFETLVKFNSAPARDERSSLFSISNLATCEPTMPQPSIPTFMELLAGLIGEVSQTYESCRGASITSNESKSV